MTDQPNTDRTKELRECLFEIRYAAEHAANPRPGETVAQSMERSLLSIRELAQGVERDAQEAELAYLESTVREHLDPESECPPDSVRDAASKIQRLEMSKTRLEELVDCRCLELREAQAELERLRESLKALISQSEGVTA